MKLIVFSILVFIFALAIKPLTTPGFFPIHDDTQVARVFEMQKALDDGMFPVRWSKDLGYGYGYPMFNFYAPFSYYVGGAASFFGLDQIVSTKSLFALALVFSGLTMFVLGEFLWGIWGGLISSVLYVLAPYSALNIYVRGNISEAWAYAFVPLFFYGLFGIYKKDKFRFVAIEAVGISAVTLSHNLTAFETSIFFIATLIFFLVKKNRKAFKLSLLGFSLGLLIASFYFIPAILEVSYTNVQSQIGGGADFRNHFVCIQQLWDSPWGFAGSAPGCIDGMSFRVGKLHIILLGLVLILMLSKWDKKKEELNLLLFSIFILSIFFMLEISKPFWELIKPMAYIQYPWRFLTFASFSSSLISGQVPMLIGNAFPKIKIHPIIYSVLIIIGAILLYQKLFLPQTILNRNSSYYTKTSNLNTTISKISDEYLPKNIQKPKVGEILLKMRFEEGSGKVIYFDEKTNFIKTFIDSSSNAVLLFRIGYFPSWKAYIDGHEVKILQNSKGVTVNFPKGAHEVKLLFTETPIEKLSDLLSLAGIMALLIGTIYANKRKIW